MLSPDTILQGRYRIVRQLGRGGMGAVYEAFDARVSSLVAVKETFATGEVHRDAFEREAKLLANLDHEAFPRVMDHFTEGEGQYLVMELVKGDDLWELLKTRGTPLPVDQVLEWADQLLDALDELHAQTPPIIHRDIKPSNLKVTPKGRIKLLDFGISKGAAGEMTQYTAEPLSVVGYTPHFAPLEQTLRSDRRWLDTFELLNPAAVAEILSSPTDPRADIYSLSATLYHLLTNQMPRDATTRAIELWSGRPDPLPRADRVNPQVPGVVAELLHDSLAVERSERPANARSMRVALDAARGQIGPTQLAETVSGHSADAVATISADKAHNFAEDEARRREKGVRNFPKPVSIRSSPESEVAPLPDAKSTPDGLGATGDAAGPQDRRSVGKIIALAVAGVFVLVVGFGLYTWITKDRVTGSGGTPLANQPAPSLVAMEFVGIPAGTFYMGSPPNDSSRKPDEQPEHPVTLSKAFEIGKYEVTQAQWRTVMGRNPSKFAGCDQCPVEQVTWTEVQAFITRLNAANDGYQYRLPTEAEWEYVARAETAPTTREDSAWFDRNSANKTHPVGQKEPNDRGVYDLAGNVWEWCQDWYGESYYLGAPETDPQGPSSGTARVNRGGGFSGRAEFLRVTDRNKFPPDRRDSALGFRLVRTP